MRSRNTLLGWPASCFVAATLACGAGEGERERHHAPLIAPLVTGAAHEPPSYEQRVASLPGGASETKQLELLLGSYCGYCHGSALAELSTLDGAGMYYVDDIDALIERGKILPGAPERSPLLLRISDGTMPPPGSEIAPPPAELVERLAAFISAL